MRSSRWLVVPFLLISAVAACSPSDGEPQGAAGGAPRTGGAGGGAGAGAGGADAATADRGDGGGAEVDGRATTTDARADTFDASVSADRSWTKQDGSLGAGGNGSLAPADGGAGGTPFVAVVPPGGPAVVRDKIDLLFMIDNSASMADKQDVLRQALPALVNRFFNPSCIDQATSRAVGSSQNGVCPSGTVAEFRPPTDMHIGIIDSSLGSRGVRGICDDDAVNAPADSHNNDNAHLITRGVAEPPQSGFLEWKAGGDAGSTNALLEDMVTGVGQHGCGYEAQLESIYRFLVDPEPPAQLTLGLDQYSRQVIIPTGIDETVLRQRASFLRPDSMVVVVLVSDEDDCSLQEDGQAWAVIAPATSDAHTLVRPGTSACRTNPNDPCCFNCASTSWPDACPAPNTDPACSIDGGDTYYSATEDPANLRCWRQKQRYGIDFLYDVKRYADGFSQPEILNRQGVVVKNPLFTNPSCAGDECPTTRDVGSLLFVAVVGVPWQDLARNPNDISQGYKSGVELASTGAWPIVLGDRTASPPVPPSDPLMIDSVIPRVATTTANPLGPAAIPNANFDAGPTANPINGHEWDTSKLWPNPNADLQYACVFDLPKTRDCSNSTSDCDCLDFSFSRGGSTPSDYKSPLCQEDSGTFTTTQRRAKAYPGLRELEVVRALGPRGVAASICPASLSSSPNGPDYGYNPVVDLIVNEVGEHLPRPDIR